MSTMVETPPAEPSPLSTIVEKPTDSPPALGPPPVLTWVTTRQSNERYPVQILSSPWRSTMPDNLLLAVLTVVSLGSYILIVRLLVA